MNGRGKDIFQIQPDIRQNIFEALKIIFQGIKTQRFLEYSHRGQAADFRENILIGAD